MSRCYEDELGRSDGACDQQPRYRAQLSYSTEEWLLCGEHAAEEMANGDVVWIVSLPRSA